jgi:hypothetical protein
MSHSGYRGLMLALIVAAFCAFGFASRAAEAAVVLNVEMPESSAFFNFCTGYLDPLTGVLHTVVTETVAGDGSIRVTIHQDNHDVKLTDPVLGACEGQESFDTTISAAAGMSSTQTATGSLREECPGAGNNQDIAFATPITLNPDGSIVIGSTTFTTISCR